MRLIPMFLVINLFYGFFSLWLTSILKGTTGLNSIWIRVINPLVMFGTNFYAWSAVYAVAPILSFICLANPIVYVIEGMRAAALGQQGYLPFWLCFSVVSLLTLVFGWDATRRLVRRLDCVP